MTAAGFIDDDEPPEDAPADVERDEDKEREALADNGAGRALPHALALAGAGLPVIPIHSLRAGACSCSKGATCDQTGKHPRTAHGLKDATTSATTIQAWFAKWPDANVAIVTGAPAGVWALDIDVRKNGPASLADLERQSGPLPTTVEAATGGRGSHLLFRHPGGDTRIKNAVALRAGIDVRGDGGYIVCPPSAHASGALYRWVRSPLTFAAADAPTWLLNMVLSPVRPAPGDSRSAPDAPSVEPTSDRSRIVERARAYARACEPAISGSGGHATTLRAAIKIVRGFGLTDAEALDVLDHDFNPICQPPWTRRDLEHKVYEARHKARCEEADGWLRDAPPPRAAAPASGPHPDPARTAETPSAGTAAAPAPSPRTDERGSDPFKVANAVPVRDVLSWLGLLTGEQPVCPNADCAKRDGSSVAIVGNGLKCQHAHCANHGKSGFYSVVDLVVMARGLRPIEAVRQLAERFGFEVPNRKDSCDATRRVALPSDVLPCTHLANAYRLHELHGKDLRHCESLGWIEWNGFQWEIGSAAAVTRRVHETARAFAREACAQLAGADTSDARDVAKSSYGWAVKSQNEAHVRATLATACVLEGIACKPDRFDGDPWLLNCSNGTLDLRTFELRPHRREDLQTKLAPVAFDPRSAAPTWTAFLAKIFSNRTELISFVQRAVGYSLTGSTAEQCLFVLWGDGANGKSTMLEVLRAVLGDFAAHTPTDTLMVTRDRGAENDLARLRGARFLTAIESGEGRRLDEERVKALTGGDTITARFLYREHFEFRPSFKLWLAVNNKPEVRGTDFGIWRRVRLVPFKVSIPREEQDTELPFKLRAEAAGILAWAVEGCRAWRAGGLQPPECVLEATSTYRAEQDMLGRFLADECEVRPEAQCTASELYFRLTGWCRRNGEELISAKALGMALGKRFEQHRATGGTRIWRGIGLIQPTERQRAGDDREAGDA